MPNTINVAIVDDHQMTVEGYTSILKKSPGIKVVSVANYGEDIPEMFVKNDIDVLLLDVSLPISSINPNPYPILHTIPELINQHPNLNILVISMHADRGLIQAVIRSGSSGYILKDDQKTLRNLAGVVADIANGEIRFSDIVWRQRLLSTDKSAELLTTRENEILSILNSRPDISIDALAEKLHISKLNVKRLLFELYRRLGVTNRKSAVNKARIEGLITPYPPEAPTNRYGEDMRSKHFSSVVIRYEVLWFFLCTIVLVFFILLRVLQ